MWPVSAEFHQAHKKFECVPILDFDLNGEQQLPSIKSIYPNDGRSARNMMMPLIFPTYRACSRPGGKSSTIWVIMCEWDEADSLFLQYFH